MGINVRAFLRAHAFLFHYQKRKFCRLLVIWSVQEKEMCPIVYEAFNEVSLIIPKKRLKRGWVQDSTCQDPFLIILSGLLFPPSSLPTSSSGDAGPCVGSCFQPSLLGLGETESSGDLQKHRSPAASVSPWGFINKWPFVVAVVA